MSLLSCFPFPLILLFVFFHFHLITSSSSSRDLIQETCKSCANSDPNISLKFCVNSLKADPRSHSASNLTALGLVSVKITRRNVSDTRVHIGELLTKKKASLDPFTRECLDDCFEVYSDAIGTLREAIRDYRAKRYADSNIKVSSVLDAASSCEDGFKEKNGVVSPLTRRNKNVFQLSAIALSIIDMLAE